MPTLHSVTENTKTLLKYGTIFIVSIFVLFLVFRGGVFIKEFFFPTPIPPPAADFGKLPPVRFPESLPHEGLTYTLDTVTGQLPTFSTESGKIRDRANVFRIINPAFSLLDLQNTKATVAEIGFFGREIPLGDNVYQWGSIVNGLERSIEMNIVNKNFTYATSFRTNPRFISPEELLSREQSIDASEKFLQEMSLFPQEIDPTKTKTELLRIQGTQLLPVETIQETDVIRVTFFQKNVDDLPVFYKNPPYSTLSFYVGVNSDVVQGELYRQIIDFEHSAYPLKPVQQAFEELQNGQAYIGANYTDASNIKIKSVELGYYASDTYQEYLIPIYVFKSIQDEFYAYVVAISDEWFIQPDSPESSDASPSGNM